MGSDPIGLPFALTRRQHRRDSRVWLRHDAGTVQKPVQRPYVNPERASRSSLRPERRNGFDSGSCADDTQRNDDGRDRSIRTHLRVAACHPVGLVRHVGFRGAVPPETARKRSARAFTNAFDDGFAAVELEQRGAIRGRFFFRREHVGGFDRETGAEHIDVE